MSLLSWEKGFPGNEFRVWTGSRWKRGDTMPTVGGDDQKGNGIWKVPVLSQASGKLCWEACGRIMWKWRFKNLAGYAKKADGYLKIDKGLTEEEMDDFYHLLGLRSLPKPKGANLRYALQWSPVVVTNVRESTGHAVVLSGFKDGKYTEINPCAVEAVDFEADSMTCQAGVLELQQPAVEDPLGTYMWYW